MEATIINIINELASGNNSFSFAGFNYQRITKETESVGIAEFTREEDRVPFGGISFNSERANLNIGLVIGGKVKLPSNSFGIDEVDSSIYRSFNIVRDGKVNTKTLKVYLSEKTFNVFSEQGLVEGKYDADKVYEINLDGFEVDEKRTVSIEDFVINNLEEFKSKAAVKVYKEFQKVNKIENLANKYGQEAAEFLQSLGVTDRGFSPDVKVNDAKGSYKALTINLKVKGMSSIPSYNAVVKKITANKKINAADQLLTSVIDEVAKKQSQLNADEFEKYIEDSIKAESQKQKALSQELFNNIFNLQNVNTNVEVDWNGNKVSADVITVEKTFEF